MIDSLGAEEQHVVVVVGFCHGFCYIMVRTSLLGVCVVLSFAVGSIHVGVSCAVVGRVVCFWLLVVKFLSMASFTAFEGREPNDKPVRSDRVWSSSPEYHEEGAGKYNPTTTTTLALKESRL